MRQRLYEKMSALGFPVLELLLQLFHLLNISFFPHASRGEVSILTHVGLLKFKIKDAESWLDSRNLGPLMSFSPLTEKANL